MELEEQFLIDGLKRRDRFVFELVFTYYYSGLCAYVNQIIEDSAAAEDIVQDFFTRLWENAKRIDITNSLKAYFFSSARNRALDYLKHKRIKRNYTNVIRDDSHIVNPDELMGFAETELRNLIIQSLQLLPPRTRQIFVLSRFTGTSNDLIAKQLNISKRTVEVQISSANKTLRSKISDYINM